MVLVEVKSNKTYTTLFGDHFNNLVVFGNPDAPAEFQNHMKMEFWGENYISFNNEGVKGTPVIDGEKLFFETPEKTYYWEPKTLNQMRWVEVLKVKSSSNKWSLKLVGHNEFNFYYQTPFTEESLKFPGSTIETFERDGEDWIRLVHLPGSGILYDERPLNIDGSYAVYHKTKRDEIVGHKNYRTGKVLHIPRPKATDADGKSVLCDLHIENGIYTRTIPQDFLDSALYPIVVNDVFGYWSSGGTATSFGPDYMKGFGPWTGAEGNATSVSVYFTNLSSTPVTLGFYDDDSNPNVLQGDSAGAVENADGWVTQNLDAPVAITAQDYWPAENHDDDAILGYYDAGSKSYKNKSSAYSAGALDNPFGTPGTISSRDYSAYITYTPSAANAPTGVLYGPLVGSLGGPV